jgi:hypothetical protein
MMGSGENWLCPIPDVYISGVEPLVSATGNLISKMYLTKIACEDGRWREMAQNSVQWWALY